MPIKPFKNLLKNLKLLFWVEISSSQLANLLLGKLSADLRSKVDKLQMNDNYKEIKAYLIEKYGGIDRIVNDILLRLSKRKKSVYSTKKEKHNFFADYMISISRLDKLCRFPLVYLDRLDSILYSFSSLSTLINILPDDDRAQMQREPASRRLDCIILVDLTRLYALRKSVY